MLQQTQVSAVIPYFERFMQRFPALADLANAQLDDVLHLWSGLGYYSRARNLHASAKRSQQEYGGDLPQTLEDLVSLPGIGRSTAGAILSLACGQAQPILDGNAKRVLCRHAGVPGWPGSTVNTKKLWSLATARTPARDANVYTQAIMDVGATVCVRKQPRCLVCPVHIDCSAYHDGLTASIPAPKPKRARPIRQTQFIIVRNARDEVWLEQRPPTGIWGGLWCFPQVDTEAGLDAWSERNRIAIGVTGELAQVRHAFSHFELVITPTIVEIVGQRTDLVATAEPHPKQRWCDPQALPNIGLAAPVARLLKQL